MDHPNIARVFDGGATASGRPYFVMELVKGVPITEYCDVNHLTPRQRLELFIPVCQAVQHAHQKGIIHRDLKPSNVLVSLHDTAPVVKVIDFGVAKALGQELTDKTLFTGFAQMIGTPLYMSPEQAGQSGLDVDTRSDIYSLGVLLYELLTGTTPFTRERFMQAGYDEIRRIIREEEPPKPSTRLSESKDALPSISAQRQTEPAKLTRLMRGDLDWIVMKCLEKDRSRRYETANGLALDIQRHLCDEPVAAGPPSAWYRFRKLARRHRRLLATLAFAGLMLMVAVVALAVSTVQISRQQQETDAAYIAEAAQRARADANFEHALSAVDRYFTRVSESEQLKAHNLERLRKDLLETAREFYERLVRERPEDGKPKAELGRAYLRLARITDELGSQREALRLYQQARTILAEVSTTDAKAVLGDLAICDDQLAGVHKALGETAAAEAAYGRALAADEELLRADPTNTTYALNRGAAYYNLGNLYVNTTRGPQGRDALQKAQTIFEDLARAQPDNPLVQSKLARTLQTLALLYHAEDSGQGTPSRAVPLLERAVAIMDKLGQAQPFVEQYQSELAGMYSSLAVVLGPSGAEKTESSIVQAVRIHEKLARTHPDITRHQLNLANGHSNLGMIYEARGKWAEARLEYEESYRALETLDAKQPGDIATGRSLAASACNVGNILNDHGEPLNALNWYGKAIRTLRAVLEKEPREMQTREFLRNAYWGRADACNRLGRHAEALAAWDRAIENAAGPRLPWLRLQRAGTVALVGGHARAAADADAVVTEQGVTVPGVSGAAPVHALCLNESARVHVLCVTLARSDDKLDQADRDRLALQYASHAVQLARKAVDLDPAQRAYWRTLGMAHYRAADWTAATTALRKSMELGKGGSSYDWFFIAMAEWKLGHPDEARKWYDQAVRWMDKNHPTDDELRRCRKEAAHLLGR
jgi:tetratricopeptide (TPR) repeat protein